jgi:hypothetical protein
MYRIAWHGVAYLGAYGSGLSVNTSQPNNVNHCNDHNMRVRVLLQIKK